METHIIQVGHIGASIERGRVFSVDGVMATITATCYKGPPPNISRYIIIHKVKGQGEL